MKFSNVGRLAMTFEFVQDMTANVQMHQAYANLLSQFIVIEARVNSLEGTIEQVIFDPSGLRLPRIEEGELIPKVTVTIGKVPSVMSIYDNPYYTNLVVPS